ncbi:hypothetical protein J4G37_16000 [Microvirga sp. 3-52]|nr:hypothetical protein [Microvirga sp. 3-52]
MDPFSMVRPSESSAVPGHTLLRHGRPCAGHPDPIRRCALRVGFTGTRPVMTGEDPRAGDDRAGTVMTEAGYATVLGHTLSRHGRA